MRFAFAAAALGSLAGLAERLADLRMPAAEVLERLDRSEAENRVLKAELARVSTILASRERELVKMKGLASPEDEVF